MKYYQTIIIIDIWLFYFILIFIRLLLLLLFIIYIIIFIIIKHSFIFLTIIILFSVIFCFVSSYVGTFYEYNTIYSKSFYLRFAHFAHFSICLNNPRLFIQFHFTWHIELYTLMKIISEPPFTLINFIKLY
jgi:hypothetical protein